VVRPGVTFRYGDKGPEGLVKGKKAYLVVARGGVYTEGPMQAFNFQDTYLKAALGFIGITDVEVIAVEGIAFGPEVAEKAVSSALGKVNDIAT
jgi:FMN-dependent NADH-azoreductase